MKVVEWLTDALVIGSWSAALLFVVRYLRVRWFATEMGRHAMGFMAAVLVVLTLAASYVIWPDWGDDGTRQVVRLISYALIFSVLVWRNVLLFTGQRGPSERHPARRAHDLAE